MTTWKAFLLSIIYFHVSLTNSYTITPSKLTNKLVPNRRSFIKTIGTACVAAATGTQKAKAAFIGSPPMIRSYPNLQYLVPIYEMDNSLAVLESQLNKGTTQGIAIASRLVDNFFKGGFLSNKNIYKGFCVVYTQEIRYDDPDRNRVQQDKVAFLDSCDATLAAMDAMRKPLKRLAENGADQPTSEVMENMEKARDGVRQFLSRVPQGDIDRIKEWTKAVKAADANRNGRVDEDELKSLSKEDQDLYRAVGDLVG